MMEAQRTNVNFSNFDLSHVHKTSMDMGKLVPIACIPTLPGDKFNIDVSAFVRGMPTIAPIMDKVDIKVNHFYVPYRILWEHFPDFISRNERHLLKGINGYNIPVFDAKLLSTRLKDSYKRIRPADPKGFRAGGRPDSGAGPNPSNSFFAKYKEDYYDKYKIGKLCNYLGLNVINDSSSVDTDLISLMPILAYNKIFLDYYVPQRWLNFMLRGLNAGREHWLMSLSKLMEDIKTSPNYSVNFSSFQHFSEDELIEIYGLDRPNRVSRTSRVPIDNGNSFVSELFSLKNVYWNHDYFTSALPEPTIYGDVSIPKVNQREYRNSNGESSSQVGGDATIRDLRKAISLQHYLETLSQGGGRYLETMELMFNKRLPDDMLQYSEYLGGSTIPLFVNEVEQTAPYENKEGQKSYLGDLSGKPVGAGDMENIHFEADEYGIYMCLAHIVPKRSYFNLTHRAWRELDVMEFPNPHFEGIGDQAVYAYELGSNTSNPYRIWGYVPRYAHYKTSLDRFSGEMQHTLSHWHLGDLQVNGSSVSPEAIECIPRNDIFQVPEEPDKMLCTFNLGIKAVRPLSYNPPVGVNRI